MEKEKSKTGCSCPKCDRTTDFAEMVDRTKPEFNDGGEHGDPHYEWEETYKCKCGQIYTVNNGT